MKPHLIAAVLSGTFLVILGVAVAGRQLQISLLTREAQERISTVLDAVDESPVEPPLETAEVPLSDTELRELLTLRREVARMRQEKSQITHLQAENVRLKSAIANVSSDSQRVTVPEDYLVAGRARFVGFATPADTLQSFLWSIRKRDTNALFQVLAPSSGQMIAETISRQGADGFFAEANRLPGFLIKSVEENSDGTASAEVQIDPHNPGMLQKFPLERDEKGAWRLRME